MTEGKGFLTGKIIKEIKISTDRKAILFVCERGSFVAETEAECCSDTWIEHIELPALGFPCKVIYQTELDLGKDPIDSGEYIQFYGHKIVTDKGEIVIDYRNSSNGWYGGDLLWPDHCWYGGAYITDLSDCKWDEVDDDQ